TRVQLIFLFCLLFIDKFRLMSFFFLYDILVSMKYIYLMMSLLFLVSCEYREEIEDYNYLDNNSIRFIKTGDDTELLINKDDIFYLIILDNKNSNIYYDYLIDMNNISSININNIIFNVNDKIEILFDDKKFCIYKKELDRDNYSDCDFIYLYKIDNDFYITLNNNISILFYDAYSSFNYRFMYMLSNVWIDSYTIDEDSYTTLTLKDNDYEVSSYKIRGKTIHKKEKT
ncbi:MAG: hypothetical protein ACI4U4_01460, partial [Bacilli bacterium]